MRVWMGRGFSTRTGSRTHEVCHQEPCSEQRAEHTGDAEVSKLLLRLHENRRLHDALRDALEDKLRGLNRIAVTTVARAKCGLEC